MILILISISKLKKKAGPKRQFPRINFIDMKMFQFTRCFHRLLD